MNRRIAMAIILVLLAAGATGNAGAAGGDPPAEKQLDATMTLVSDPGGDAGLIAMPAELSLLFEFQGGAVGALSGPHPVVSVGGNVIKDGEGGWSLLLGGAADRFGIMFVDAIFDGRLLANGQTLYGVYRFGTEGELPGGQEVVYQVRTADIGGDVDKNGRIDAIDALLALQFGAGLIEGIDNADVNIDGDVTAVDAALILQLVAGRIDVFPLP